MKNLNRREFITGTAALTAYASVTRSWAQSPSPLLDASRRRTGGGGGPTGTPIISAVAPVISPRRGFNGDVGMRIFTGGAPITITALGRWIIAGNNQVHYLRLVYGYGTNIETVALNTVGKTANAFAYVNLVTPFTTAPGTQYFILSSELDNSPNDEWGDQDTVSGTVDVAIDGSAYANGGNPNIATFGSVCFVPVSGLYHL